MASQAGVASSLNSLTPLILGGAALYFLSKSDFFKGLGQVGSGAGTAVQGAGTAVADITGNVSGATDVLDIFGQAGRSSAGLMKAQSDVTIAAIKQKGEIDATQRAREAQQETQSDQAQYEADLAGQIARNNMVEAEKTEWMQRITTADNKIISGVKSAGSKGLAAAKAVVKISPAYIVATSVSKSLKTAKPAVQKVVSAAKSVVSKISSAVKKLKKAKKK